MSGQNVHRGVARRLLHVTTLEHLALALWHSLVLLPMGVVFAVLIHAIPLSDEQKRPFSSLMRVHRLPVWSYADTVAVAVATQILAACSHLEQIDVVPTMEQIMPRFTKMALGVRHQGWQIQCEAVTIPSIPTEGVDDEATTGSIVKEQEPMRPALTRVVTAEALPHSNGLTGLLQGFFTKGIPPPPCASLWLWKTQAAHVKNGKVIAVRADSDRGGLGCGPAQKDEHVILQLAGSGVQDRGPLVGPLAWTIARQSGLRMLIVKTRKMDPKQSGSHPFAAAMQGALAGYAYLVDRLGFLPRNITLLGDGASASLCSSLCLYLSALSHSAKAEDRMGRPGKMLLFSPWCDMTVPEDILQENGQSDVVDVNAQIQNREKYRSTFSNAVGDEKRDLLLDELCRRYGDEAEELEDKDEENVDLASLGAELASTIDALGISHPLVSPGMPVACNKYTKMAMQLLHSSDVVPLKVLICAGSAEVHVTEARSLATNLSTVEGLEIDYIEGEDMVAYFPLITSSPANARVDELCQAFLAS